MTTTDTPTTGRTVDPHLSSRDVAAELGITRGHAARLMREGVIPGVVDLSTGGERATLRIRRSALAAWVDSRAL